MPGDILFDTVERYHEGKEWGRLLDAGTGVNSVKWMMGLESCTEWVAITADERMKKMVADNKDVKLRDVDQLVVGNWMDEAFCATLGTFDTIVADYLIGAVDGFSPFKQDLVIKKLKEHLRPGGRLYLIGMYPIPDHAVGAAQIVCEVRRARDACILMGGHRCYREYPSEWIIRFMEREGLKVFKSKAFTIMHTENSVTRQINVARTKLSLMTSDALRDGMADYLDELQDRTKEIMAEQPKNNIPLSHDYVIAAELAIEGEFKGEGGNVMEGVVDGEVEGKFEVEGGLLHEIDEAIQDSVFNMQETSP